MRVVVLPEGGDRLGVEAAEDVSERLTLVQDRRPGEPRLERLEREPFEVRRAVAALPERQRVEVALRDLDGRTAEEVAEVMGISPGNQRVLLHRGRSAVRAHLEKYLEVVR